MKTTLTRLTAMSALFFCVLAKAQVGIGTTTPRAALDITSSNSGMLVPRVQLTSLTVAAPVTNPQGGNLENGTMVYNLGPVAPGNLDAGFYYWYVNRWVAVAGAAPATPTDAWNLTGNAGTNSSVNFIGTTDAQDLTIRAGGDNKFRISHTNNQILSVGSGVNSNPAYSWEADPSYGFYMASGTNIRVATNGTNRFQFPNAPQVHAMANGTAALPFYSWVNATTTGMFKIGNTTNAQLAFATNATERMRITQAGNVGIASETPRTLLEVGGALSLKEGAALILANGNNNNIALGTVPYSLYRITGPEAAFNISGVVPVTDSDGQLVTLQNTTENDMIIFHNAVSTAANRILCPGAKNLVLRGQYATVTLQYNASQSRWIVVSYAGDTPQVDKPAIYSVLGSTDISVAPATYPSPGSYSDMSQMTLTFTPESSVVYLNFSASGDLDTASLPGSNHIKFRIVNVTASNTTLGGAVSVSTDYDEDYWGNQMVASGWSVGFNMFPVTVTPGVSTTLKIQWSAVGIYAATARNYANSARDHSHRTLSVIDYKN